MQSSSSLITNATRKFTSIDEVHLHFTSKFASDQQQAQRLKHELPNIKDEQLKKQLEQQISHIESRSSEIEYYLKAGPDLIRYSRGGHQSTHDIYLSYLKASAPVLVPVDSLGDKAPIDTWCQDCRTEKILTTTDSACYVCPCCGDTTIATIESERPSFRDPPTDTSSQDYDRIGHFRDWLMYKQGRENTKFSDNLFPILESEIAIQGLTDPADRKQITQEMVYKWLKKHSNLGFNRYFEHVPLIHCRLTGIAPKRMTREQEMFLCDMFVRIQPAYERHKPPNRKSCISYSYLLRKFCELLGYTDWIDEFKLVKDKKTLYELDVVWRNICMDMGGPEAGWTFNSSF